MALQCFIVFSLLVLLLFFGFCAFCLKIDVVVVSVGFVPFLVSDIVVVFF